MDKMKAVRLFTTQFYFYEQGFTTDGEGGAVKDNKMD